MANNYLQFSFTVSLRNKTEEKWWKQYLADPVSAATRILGDKAIENNNWGEIARLIDGSIDTANSEITIGCEIEEPDPGEKCIWIHADEYGNPDPVALILKAFLKEARPAGTIGFTWAATCSEPKVNEFDGGGVQITAKKIEYHGTGKVSTSKN